MIKRLINYIIEKKIEREVFKKLSKIKAHVNLIGRNKALEIEYVSLWSELRKSPNRKFLYAFAGVNGMYSALYVPEDFYYQSIEPVLNNKSFAPAYSDKNFYERYLSEYAGLFPECILRGINGFFYNASFEIIRLPDSLLNYLQISETYILKPSIETSGGSKVELVTTRNGKIYFRSKELSGLDFMEILKNEYSGNFVIQKKIEANVWYTEFNPSSLNTLRLFTYRSVINNEVSLLSSVLRFGRPGSIVDNQAAGGLTCGISIDGKLNHFAITKYGEKLSFDFVKSKAGTLLPGYEKMKEIAIELASKYYYHRLLGFDFCLDTSGNVRLLEINCKNIEVNFLQMNNGPLFGSFTEEIISFCKQSKKSLVLDFYV